jgi:hypothetical protein
VPVWPAAAALRVWGVFRLPPRLKPEQVLRLADQRDWGYAPRSWREGLAEEVEALQERPARSA